MTMRRRARRWYTVLRESQALGTNNQISFSILGNVPQANKESATVVRMLTNVHLRGDTVGAVKTIDYGVTWVDTEAVVSGSLPDVDQENDRQDWLMRERMVNVTAALTDEQQVTRERLDIRTKRVWRSEEDQLMLIFDSDNLTSGGVFVTFSTRVLILLPP